MIYTFQILPVISRFAGRSPSVIDEKSPLKPPSKMLFSPLKPSIYRSCSHILPHGFCAFPRETVNPPFLNHRSLRAQVASPAEGLQS